MNPGYRSLIFLHICQEAWQRALSAALAHRLKTTTFKLEVHHCLLRFTNTALKNQLAPKTLRFKPPSNQPVFRRIMDRASKHGMGARISIWHDQIKSSKVIGY